MANIMVVDDVEDAGVLIARILERKGHQVTVFTEEEDAIKHAAKQPADLAILDIKLKKMTGVDLLEELKRVSPKLKAMMLTGYPTLETAQAALSLGADEYCIKPIDKSELEQKVAQILDAPQ